MTDGAELILSKRSIGLFWAKVAKGPGCWEWTAALSKSGYGKLSRNGTVISAHRAAWKIAHGAIPSGMWVLHHCDNRVCVKTEGDSQWPDGHLFLGTAQDNNRDSVAKGRHARHLRPDRVPRGSRKGPSKLTEAQVPIIRAMLALGWYQREVGAWFGVNQSIISRIARGVAWIHVK